MHFSLDIERPLGYFSMHANTKPSAVFGHISIKTEQSP